MTDRWTCLKVSDILVERHGQEDGGIGGQCLGYMNEWRDRGVSWQCVVGERVNFWVGLSNREHGRGMVKLVGRWVGDRLKMKWRNE